MKINSVLGPLDTKELGVVLMHEHYANTSRDMIASFGKDWIDTDIAFKRFDLEIQKTKKDHGLKTFVEGSPINLGRDVHFMIDAAKRNDINIITGTGMYYNEYPYFGRLNLDGLVDYYIKDITVGMEGTDARAAFTKFATDDIYEKSESNLIMAQAAGIAAVETGVPVYTHDNNQKTGYGQYQLDILTKQGVAPNRICIGHAFTGNRIDYIMDLLKSGCYVGCDQVGYENMCTTENFANNVIKVCEAGYADKILFSHDMDVTSDYIFSNKKSAAFDKVEAKGSYSIVFEKLADLVVAGGVSREKLNEMFTDNPVKYFEGA